MPAPPSPSPSSSFRSNPPAPLPVKRADVLVIGAGLSGLGVAGRLAERGVDVVVVEASEAAAEPAGIGLVETAPPGLFSRNVAARGGKTAATLHELSRRNADLMSSHPCAGPSGFRIAGCFHLTTEAAELAELRESARLLREHVPSAAAWEVLEDAGQVASRTGTRGFLGGVFRPHDAMIDARAFLRAAESGARSSGAKVVRGAAVVSLETDSSSRPRAVTDRGVVQAEMIVVCAGAGSAGLHGSLRERIVPVLGQGLSIPGLDLPASPDSLVPVSANFGHLAARTTIEEGHARLSAWNIPWSLRGSDPEGKRHEVQADQQARIEAYLAEHFPSARRRGSKVDQRWAAHHGWTIDSLPLAGPAPGQPRLVFCTGFSGHEWSLALYAARVVADGLMGEAPPEEFGLLSPRRFLEG